MAKDGTNRGGARPGTGPKKQALNDKIAAGKASKSMVLPEPTDIVGIDIPPVKEYLKAKQKNGKDLCAEDVFIATFTWLKGLNCDRLVNVQLIEQYAMSVSRWIQCEEAITQFGFLAKKPTGTVTASPYVTMAREYMKQANAAWFQIYQIVKENCSVDFSGPSPQDDAMERLLRAREAHRY